ncbi:hypothetical protein [Pseudorhodoferax soli]|uniref:hypothetical protein n=1 Tax=Pseudorhodoferax soli TaxID=545864 RepID=UPI001FE9B293|nr:hypothetical protein [Pseudorhodoferax soli]
MQARDDVGELGRHLAHGRGGGPSGHAHVVQCRRRGCERSFCDFLLCRHRVQLCEVRLQHIDIDTALCCQRLEVLGARAAAGFHRRGGALDRADQVLGRRVHTGSSAVATFAHAVQAVSRPLALAGRSGAERGQGLLGLVDAGFNARGVGADFELGFEIACHVVPFRWESAANQRPESQRSCGFAGGFDSLIKFKGGFFLRVRYRAV